MDNLIVTVVQYAPAVAVTTYLVYSLMRTVERMTDAVIESQMRIVDTLERLVRECSHVSDDQSS